MRRAGAFLALAACTLACGRARPEKTAAAAPPADPDQLVLRFTMDSYAGTERVWTLKAPRARMFDSENRLDIEEPRLRFFEKGKPGSTVSAARGALNTKTKDFVAGGGVVLTSTEGATLKSDWMRYDGSAERLVSTAAVVITRGRSRVEGVGWRAAPDLSSIEILNQRGTIAGEDVEKFRRKP